MYFLKNPKILHRNCRNVFKFGHFNQKDVSPKFSQIFHNCPKLFKAALLTQKLPKRVQIWSFQPKTRFAKIVQNCPKLFKTALFTSKLPKRVEIGSF